MLDPDSTLLRITPLTPAYRVWLSAISNDHHGKKGSGMNAIRLTFFDVHNLTDK